MPSSVDEQPPSRPPRPRPRPQASGRRPPARARATAAREPAPRRRQRAAAPPPRRRPPVDRDYDIDERAPRAAKGSSTKLVVLLSVLSVLVISLAGFGISLASRADKDPLPPAASGDTPVPVTTFRDTETGFTVEYPRSWRKVEVPVAEYRLALDGGSEVAFTIRVVPIQTPANASNLENFKAVTDGLVGSNNTVKLLKQQAISMNGMLGYYYFYTFVDGTVEAVHAHYFLFSGHKMNILVFQALPDDFQTMAPTFDRIAESFRSDPNVPPAPATTATAPSTSTTVP
jgi:hypothetical protein